MLHLETTPQFDRRLVAFIKGHPDLRERTMALIDRLAASPFDLRNKTHKLGGKLRAFWGANITWSYRITFIIEEDRIVLINVGPHDEVYR